MKKVHINFSNEGRFKDKQIFNSETALTIGGFDSSIQYKHTDIDSFFLSKNDNILKQPRGFGYWIWKPYFILKSLEELNDGDILFYSDSGSIFIRNLEPLFNKIITPCFVLQLISLITKS